MAQLPCLPAAEALTLVESARWVPKFLPVGCLREASRIAEQREPFHSCGSDQRWRRQRQANQRLGIDRVRRFGTTFRPRFREANHTKYIASFECVPSPCNI